MSNLKFTEVIKTGKTTGVSNGQGGLLHRNVYSIKKAYEEVTEVNRELIMRRKAVLESELIEIENLLSQMPEEDEPTTPAPEPVTE